MRVAILSHQAPAGDAIGNSIADKAAFFLDRSAQVRLFVEVIRPIHQRLRPIAHGISTPEEQRQAIAFMADADLVLVEYGQYYPALNLLPVLAGRKPRIVLDYHGVTPPALWSTHNREALLFGWQRRGVAWCADRVIVHSKFAAEELHSACRFPPERTIVLPHPVNGALIEGAERTDKKEPSIRAELGLENCKIVLFVGRVAPNKRLGVLISALARSTPDVHLLVVGSTQDLYRQEVERCLALAQSLGIRDRIHVLGHVDEQRLLACYAAADLFVMPSCHEGFCIPILEAMALKLPVVAAHAGALPETVGDAGLLFTPDDDAELAERMKRVLRSAVPSSLQRTMNMRRRPRVAVVCFRFGPNVVGGAEKSLTLMASALQDAGATVEVFTTCTQRERGWANDLPAGSGRENGLLIHRYPIDPVDQSRHNTIVRRVLDADGQIDAAGEQEFIRQSIHSASLMAELTRRIDEFDAVLTGPYLAGLTYDVSGAFPEKTLLAGCFHDEAVVRMKLWRQAYRQVGGILYHSAAEKAFAERSLGLNHPRSAVVGTWLEMDRAGDAVRGQTLAGSKDYVLYCGRFSPQKNLPLLLDWFRAFQVQNPSRLSLVLAGQGSVTIPSESWCRNLGFIDDQAKDDLLAGARAVVHLSVNESLSLVALEAWANGTPVIAHRDCRVLVDLVQQSGGGVTVADSDSFERALVDLFDRPDYWREQGQRARQFVAAEFGSRARFTEKLLDTVFSLSTPLAEIMKERGRRHALSHSLASWRDAFGRALEETLDAEPAPMREAWQVMPHRPRLLAHSGQETAFIPIRLRNEGSHAALPDGPGARVLVALTVDSAVQDSRQWRLQTLLPGVIVPGEQISMVVRVGVPETVGCFRVEIRCQGATQAVLDGPADAVVELVVAEAEAAVAGSCGPLLQAAGAALAQADRRQELPDDYVDVTEGRLAGVKKQIKQKLLGNFKHAYVDVLSRRQSAFNRSLLEAVQETLECCALLDHAISASTPRGLQNLTEAWSSAIERAVSSGRAHEVSDIIKDLLQEVLASRTRQDQLERRVAALEQATREDGPVSPSINAGHAQEHIV